MRIGANALVDAASGLPHLSPIQVREASVVTISSSGFSCKPGSPEHKDASVALLFPQGINGGESSILTVSLWSSLYAMGIHHPPAPHPFRST